MVIKLPKPQSCRVTAEQEFFQVTCCHTAEEWSLQTHYHGNLKTCKNSFLQTRK